MCTGQGVGDEKAGLQYLLSDLADQSVYKSGQFFTDSAINPCIESSYRFVDLVVKAVVKIYKVGRHGFFYAREDKISVRRRISKGLE